MILPFTGRDMSNNGMHDPLLYYKQIFKWMRGKWCKRDETRNIRDQINAKPKYVNAVPDSKVHGVNMGHTWVMSAPDGPNVGPMNLAIRGVPYPHCLLPQWLITCRLRVPPFCATSDPNRSGLIHNVFDWDLMMSCQKSNDSIFSLCSH